VQLLQAERAAPPDSVIRSATPRFVGRPGARHVAFAEYGAADGVPLFYLGGTPASRLGGAYLDAPAKAAGVRVITMDRPGFGHSTPVRTRRLLDWPPDVLAVADRLGLDRFSVLGMSGGGPHALACAYSVPERLTATIVVAGMGPGHDRAVTRGMTRPNATFVTLAQRAPWLLAVPTAVMARALATPDRARTAIDRQRRALSGPDRELLDDPAFRELVVANAVESFRQGSRAVHQELLMLCRPWGFELEDITAPVELWHGTDDRSVPLAVALEVARRLPRCTPRILEGVAHANWNAHLDEILAGVAAAPRDESVVRGYGHEMGHIA
jgi:pimeloyl-ACP methyl ester carboxylesterase